MKNTLPPRERALSYLLYLLWTPQARWIGGVAVGLIGSSMLLIVGLPLMIIGAACAAVWFLYMSVFDQSGLKRMSDRSKERQRERDDELRDEISTN